jgi:hypothetical protein
MTRRTRQPIRHWTGAERGFDIIFEGVIATVIVIILVIGATVIFGSADAGLSYPGGPKSATGEAFSARYWSTSPMTDDQGNVDPNGGAMDFVATVVTELDGSSGTAGYGPPYNETQGASQVIGPFSPTAVAHTLVGLTLPVNTANDFVLAPLSQVVAPYDPAVAVAVRTYEATGGSLQPGVSADQLVSDRQAAWLAAYTSALAKATINDGRIAVAPGNYGPVPVLVQAELTMARNGALDNYLLSSNNQIETNPTKATLFYSDGALWGTIATAQGISGDQWGVMNELWNFPGQFWLILYAIPYHIPAIADSSAADLWVVILVVIAALLQLFLPWIPGLRDIPRVIPLYKVIYRRYYRQDRDGLTGARDGHAPPDDSDDAASGPSTPVPARPA